MIRKQEKSNQKHEHASEGRNSSAYDLGFESPLLWVTVLRIPSVPTGL